MTDSPAYALRWFTYWRIERTQSIVFNNYPLLIVQATNITDADEQFKNITGTHPAKLGHVALRMYPTPPLVHHAITEPTP